MIRHILFGVFLVVVTPAPAQQSYIDSLRNEVTRPRNDTLRLILLAKMANAYSEIYPDSAFHYAEKALVIARNLNLKLEEVAALGEMGYALLNQNNYSRSLQILLSAIPMAEDVSSEKNILPCRFPATDIYMERTVSARQQRLSRLSQVMQYTSVLYRNSGDYRKSLYYFELALPQAQEAQNHRALSIYYLTHAITNLVFEKPDSALYCLQRASDFAKLAHFNKYMGSIYLNSGRVYKYLDQKQKAKGYFKRALIESTTHDYFRGIVACHLE
jgi:tetratricopeptide (TPR) repeat protein